tara:strand:- start:1389 stop:1577 length:189 start_codon:yes stop_codon:yes gene_type:complete
MDALIALVANQTWYEIAGEIVLIASSITMLIEDKFMQGNPILAKINTGLNFLSLNIFKNKNQ